MTGEEIIRIARSRLADTVEPYLWDPFVLVQCLNEAINDFCRETLILADSTTDEICKIDILSGKPLYLLDSRVLLIEGAQLANESWPLEIIYMEELNRYFPAWRNTKGTPRYYVPEYETQRIILYPFYDDTAFVMGSKNISFVQATKTIIKPSGLDVFKAGDQIKISGTGSNDGTFTVISASASEIVVAEDLIDETATSAEIRKIIDTLWLSVRRLPIQLFDMSNLDSQIELPMVYHEKLIPGILKYAYLNDDERTLDVTKANMYEQKFMINVAMAKIDRVKKTGRWNSTVGLRIGCM